MISYRSVVLAAALLFAAIAPVHAQEALAPALDKILLDKILDAPWVEGRHHGGHRLPRGWRASAVRA